MDGHCKTLPTSTPFLTKLWLFQSRCEMLLSSNFLVLQQHNIQHNISLVNSLPNYVLLFRFISNKILSNTRILSRPCTSLHSVLYTCMWGCCSTGRFHDSNISRSDQSFVRKWSWLYKIFHNCPYSIIIHEEIFFSLTSLLLFFHRTYPYFISSNFYVA